MLVPSAPAARWALASSRRTSVGVGPKWNSEYFGCAASACSTSEFARASGYQFPYLQDQDQRAGRAYGARRTFEIFVLDRHRTVRYHGRFDDARLPERVTTHDLRNALDDLLAGRPVRVPETRDFGCSLDYV